MLRALIIDDSETVRDMIVNGLRQAHRPITDVVEATTASEALREFLAGEYHVVFLDMVLGEERTVDLLRSLLKARPDARIVIITALPREDPDLVTALGIGGYAYIEKPVRVEAVRSLLDQIESEQGNLVRIPPPL